ncbi:MAG: hypothetical protein ABI678_30680 [Kofleriaceae bacterium]
MSKTLCLLAILAGCYDHPPPRVPRIDAPTLVPGAVLEVDSRVTAERRRVTDRERVCVGGSCDTVSVTSHAVLDIHHASATYNGQAVTFGQIAALSDPTYTTDWKRLDELTDHCEHAAKPKLLGETLFSLGILGVVLGAGTTDGSIKEPYFAAGIAGLAGGIAAYALGKYVFGGQDCGEAQEIYDRRRGQYSVVKEQDVEGASADELETLAKDFNARMGTPTAEK